MTHQVSLAKKGDSPQDSICSKSIELFIDTLRAELHSILTITIGKPARYYTAYKTYALAYGIMQLEELLLIASPIHTDAIRSLLSAYQAAANIESPP